MPTQMKKASGGPVRLSGTRSKLTKHKEKPLRFSGRLQSLYAQFLGQLNPLLNPFAFREGFADS
jgi:hypothetical protein